MVKCFFCDEGEANADAAREVKMYKIQSTKYGIIENKLTESFSIPRCSRCRSVHKMKDRIVCLITLIIFSSWGYVNVWVFRGIAEWVDYHFGEFGFFIYIYVLGLYSGLVIGDLVGKKYRPAIKSEDKRLEYPPIASSIQEGYEEDFD